MTRFLRTASALLTVAGVVIAGTAGRNRSEAASADPLIDAFTRRAQEEGLTREQTDGKRLFVTSFRGGSMLMELDAAKPAARVVWKNNIVTPGGAKSTLGIHSTMSNPLLQGGEIYGVCAFGELRCVDATTGARVWESFAATGGQRRLWGHAYLIPHEQRCFLFNEDGDLIIARLARSGYEELSRAHIIDPDDTLPGRAVAWAHPAFAERAVFGRSDSQIVCVSLADDEK